MLKNNKYGFTLLEIIASILVMSVIILYSTYILSDIVENYSRIKEKIEITQKARRAIFRLVTEFMHLNTILSVDKNTIEFQARLNNNDITSVSYGGNRLFINGAILIDNVTSFKIEHADNLLAFNDVNQVIWSEFKEKDNDTGIVKALKFHLTVKSSLSNYEISFNDIMVVPRYQSENSDGS